MVRTFLVVLALVAAPVAWVGAQGPSSQSLLQLMDEYWEWRLAQEPELATRVGRTDHNDVWRDWSRAARDRVRDARREYLQKAIYLSPGTLTPEWRLSAFVLEYELQSTLDASPWIDATELVTQMGGAHTEVFTTIGLMPAQSVRDYENILSRLRALSTYVDQQMALEREQMAAGITQPALVVDLMLEQMAAQRKVPANRSPLLAAFREFPAAIPAAEQRRLRAAATAAYQQQFVTGWTRWERFLRSVYRPKARPQIAFSSIPDGARAYETLIHYYTTTKMSAAQVHELGLSEVARLDAEMQRVARDAGFSGTVAEFERELASRPGMMYGSQQEMLEAAREALARVQPQLPTLFGRLPKTAVGVRPIPPDREAATASNYTAGSADGSRQAWFNMNTYRPTQQPRYVTEALVLHETAPGHHVQVSLARELEGLPEFRKVFRAAAFSEGWALYAESLGAELGLYRDPASRFGRLASEKFRAVRLVLDTGIHAMGWSRARAREYFEQQAPSQSIAEVDRYIAFPGQALAYKVGQLRILELRRRAERELGSRFDIRAFHDAVLKNGALPLDLLEEQVSAYIEGARAH